MLDSWIARSISLLSCASWFIWMQMWDHPIFQLLPHLVCQLPPASVLQQPPCRPSYSPQLPISAPPTSLMNISYLTPWLSDFHTVQFSVSSGCFLFLNLLLSFFWLWEEAQCIYLRLHLDESLFLNHMQWIRKISTTSSSALLYW